jgi:hypothetical protein
MKSNFIFLSLLISNITFAQSNLPDCLSPPFNSCYGQWVYDSGDKYIGEWLNNKKMVKEHLPFQVEINTWANG